MILCVFSSFKINAEMKKFIDMTEDIEYQLENDNTENAVKLAEDMACEWEKTFKMLNPLIRYDVLTCIHSAVIRLKPLIENDSDEILAETADIKSSLDKIRENEIPKIF
jgi:hypothetical protein